MEEEKAAPQAPKSTDEKELEAAPAADAEEKKVDSTDDAAESSKEAADDKKPEAEEASKSADAADKPKENEEEEDKSPSEVVDSKKNEGTSESMEVDEPKEEPKKDEAESPSEAGSDSETKKPSVPAPTGRGMRQRKSTQAYQPGGEKKKKELVIPKGKGVKLGDMPNVVANFKDVTWSDPDLNCLHTVVFGQGKKKEYKAHLLQFNGVVYPEGKEEAEQDKMRMRMYKLKMEALKDTMDFADIDRSAESFESKKAPGKEELCERFLEWLENPKAKDKKTPKKGKRKSTGSAGKGSAKKETPTKKAKKTTPSKKTPSKKTTPAKKTPPAKKAVSAKKKTPIKMNSAIKKAATKKAATKKAATAAKGATKKSAIKAVDLNIPGIELDKLREKVKSIVENADRKELTVKMVRKMLEDWLDTDLTEHKDSIRSLVMEVM